jgi:hypothetical protein
LERFHPLVVELYLFKVGGESWSRGEDFSEPIVQTGSSEEGMKKNGEEKLGPGFT